jgi:hypothetical protein
MNREVLSRLVEGIENKYVSNLDVQIVVLADFKDFKQAIRNTFSSTFDDSTIRAAYAGAKATLLRIQNNVAKRDPLRYKVLVPFIETQQNTYMVGSTAHALKTVRTEVREYLGSVKPIDSSEKLHQPFITLKTKEAKDFLESSYLASGKIASDSIKTVQSAIAYYNVTAGLSAGVTAKFTFVLETLFDPPGMQDVLNRLSTGLVDINTITNKIGNDVFNALRSKPTKAQYKKTGKYVYTNKATPKIVIDKPINIQRKSGKNMSALSLLNQINRRLPEQIKKNMGTPKLNWRTGRFAHSARALSISSSNEIKYTYMKRPYAVFEMSSLGNAKWATSARDPRPLITLSIREIAASITNEKFKFRRV